MFGKVHAIPQNEETPGGGDVVAANGGKTAEEGESAKKRAERSPKTETEKNDMTLKWILITL